MLDRSADTPETEPRAVYLADYRPYPFAVEGWN